MERDRDEYAPDTSLEGVRRAMARQARPVQEDERKRTAVRATRRMDKGYTPPWWGATAWSKDTRHGRRQDVRPTERKAINGREVIGLIGGQPRRTSSISPNSLARIVARARAK